MGLDAFDLDDFRGFDVSYSESESSPLGSFFFDWDLDVFCLNGLTSLSSSSEIKLLTSEGAVIIYLGVSFAACDLSELNVSYFLEFFTEESAT